MDAFQASKDAIERLVSSVEEHRLCFLFFADARRSATDERFAKEDLLAWKGIADDLERGEEFLRKHQWALEQFAQEAVNWSRPIECDTHGYGPEWLVDLSGAIHLESSANKIFVESLVANRNNNDKALRDAILKAQTATHSDGENRWYAGTVNWKYLKQLDEAIDGLRKAGVEFIWRGMQEAPSNDLGRYSVYDKDSQREVVFDSTGLECWGPAYEYEGWNGDDVPDYALTMRLYRHASKYWTLITASEHCEGGSLGLPEAERISDEEAVGWLMRHGLDVPIELSSIVANHEFSAGPPLARTSQQAESEFGISPDAGDEQIPFEVFDKDMGCVLVFDGRGLTSWHGEGEDGWNIHEDIPEFTLRMDLFRHESGHWTLVTERVHWEAGAHSPPNAERLSDEQAVEWLVRHGHDVPRELSTLAEPHLFKPGMPQGAPSDCPVWDAKLSQLTFRGQVIRNVKPSGSKNLVKILECFELDGWSRRIDSPFGDNEDGKTTRREALRTLNRNLEGIRFKSDGTGEGILWELSD